MTKLISLDYNYELKPRGLNYFIYNQLKEFDEHYHKILSDFHLLDEFFMAEVRRTSRPDLLEPTWSNGWLPPIDAMSLCYFLHRFRPSTYVEIGSGNSTLFVSSAKKFFGLCTKIISIDPEPRAHIDSFVDKIYLERLENMDLSLFSKLQMGDILFVDNSHRSFQNSDVTVFFTEILPLLTPGVVVGLHDIFLPYDYPEQWEDRIYNEQYLLTSFLIGRSTRLRTLLPIHHCFMSNNAQIGGSIEKLFKRLDLADLQRDGGCFWFEY
jgi:hypothetical protein